VAFSVLVVCVGNVCRSPLAERLLQFRLDELLGASRDHVQVTSAGVLALAGSGMDPSAAEELQRLGGTSEGFAAQQFTAQQVEGADLVLTMTKELRSRVLEEAPSALRRTFTLTEFAELVEKQTADSPQALVADAALRRSSALLDDYDVADPIGGPAELHREVAEMIDDAVRRVADALAESIGSATLRSR